ncbi:MAG: enoyl-CoA hydratase-related protein [Pseudomonadota bacterium]
MPQKSIYLDYHNPLFHTPARQVPKAAAIIGAGTIGPDIGYYLKSALPEMTLYLVDISRKSLENAEARLKSYAEKGVKRKKMSAEKAQKVIENIFYTDNYQDIKNCDLVIEAAIEDVGLKQKIFAQVEDIVSKSAILTSNTSSIPADRIFAKVKHPERTTVTHFFAPAWQNIAVEIINWEKAHRDTIEYLFWLFGSTGKAPVITDNVLCFMLDRIFDNWCNEAAYLLQDATAAEICRTVEEFAHQGPFYVLNMGNGNPIITETNTLQMEEGKHYKPSPMFPSVDKWLVPRPGTDVPVSDERRRIIRDRMLAILFSQSFDIVDRKIGSKADLNFGCQAALGFKKGPLDIMRDLGEEEVMRIMAKFEKDRPGFPQPKQRFEEYVTFNRHVLVDDIDGVKVITIRRPQALNASNEEVTNEILAVLKSHADDPAVKGFVLTGYGDKAFCAGSDIGRFPETLGNPEAAAKYARDFSEVQLYMDRMDKPVVAAVNGLSLGGGMEIAIRCHAIIAAKSAKFQLPEVTLGITPGVGGCIVPYRKWPKGAAIFHEMICLARPLSATEALEIGMVDKMVDGAELIKAAVSQVEKLIGNIPRIPDGEISLPPISLPDAPASGNLALSKEVVNILRKTIEAGAKAKTFSEALEAGYQGAAQAACTDAAKEGIGAFLEKRTPNFER